MNLEYKYIATTFSGLEEVLENELIELGAENTHILTRAVSFEGDRTIMYRTNMYCRTALQILVELNTGIVNSSDDIYDLVMDVIALNTLSGLALSFGRNIFVHTTHFVSMQ